MKTPKRKDVFNKVLEVLNNSWLQGIDKAELASVITENLSSLPERKMTEPLKDWSIPNGDSLDVPDEFDKLFHKIGMQMRFHTISGKNEFITIAHIIQICHEFFTGVKYEKNQQSKE